MSRSDGTLTFLIDSPE